MRHIRPVAIAALLCVAVAGCGVETADDGGEPEPRSAPPAAQARVVCTADGARVGTTVVAPRPDGVHVELVNETGAALTLQIAGPGLLAGLGAPAGTSAQVLDVHPGSVTVSCVAPDSGAVVGRSAAFEVVDEDGLFVSPALACDQVAALVIDYVPGARGEKEPLTAARTAFAGYGLEPDDVVEPAGYPEGEERRYRLVRNGQTVGAVVLRGDGAGAWLADTVETCSPEL